MGGYKIQLKDKNGNRQYPVSTVDVVVDADGVSVADLLDRKQPTLVSGVNIKTINGKTLLGEGDLVIEGGTADLSGYATEEYVDAKVGESYPIYYSYDGTPLTEEQKAANKMAVDKYVADESIILYPYNSSVGHPFDVVLTLSGGVWETAELTNYIFAYFNDDGTTMHYVKVTVEQDGNAQVEFSAQSPLVLASKAYVDSKVGGESVLGNNVITLYEPTIDGDTDEIVSTDECLAEIENNFGYDIEIPQEIKDAVSAFIISMKEHNTAEYARARELTENGEKVMVMLRGYNYPMIFLGIYLIALVETGEHPMTAEEFVSSFNVLTQAEEMIFPKGYIAASSVEGEFGIEVSYDGYTLLSDENGEWAITGTESVRKYAILYYEGTARLTAQQCETNLKSKGNRLNNCDFQVNRYRGDGWSDNEDVLIISKSTKTVSDFVNLNGDVVTCGVTAFQYIENTKLIELQVSNEDGYCRRVELGKVDVGENGGGSNITETDPVFKASPAAKITDSNITNWNKAEANVQSDWNATDSSSDAYIKNKPTIPAAVTESTVSGWGFTKNTGTYSKPSTGIPKSDLASSVQTSLGKADTALQSYTEQYKGTVTGVKVNDSIKSPSNGIVDLGTIPTTIDASMSDTSTNPAQNKAVKAYVDSKAATAGQMPVLSHGSSETTVELTPNVMHRWTNAVSQLTISLKSVSSSYVQHYMMQFTTSTAGCTLTMPSGIQWASGLAPIMKPGTTYQISIVNYCGVWNYYA